MLKLIGNSITAQLFEPTFAAVRSSPPPRSSKTRMAWSCAPSSLTAPGFMTSSATRSPPPATPQPDLAANRYVMLRDGATTAGYLGDPSQARDAFDRSVAELLRFIDEPAETNNPVTDSTSTEAARTSTRTSAQSQ
jgi:hypothetical protein